jgi:hypothetical protein
VDDFFRKIASSVLRQRFEFNENALFDSLGGRRADVDFVSVANVPRGACLYDSFMVDATVFESRLAPQKICKFYLVFTFGKFKVA